MWIGVLLWERSASIMNASTSARVYALAAGTTLSFEFTLFLLFFFGVDAEFVGIKVAAVLLPSFVAGAVRLVTDRTLHLRAFFLRKPPNLAFFFRCTRWIVRSASFAKPCVRRIAFRSALGLQTFIRRRPLPPK